MTGAGNIPDFDLLKSPLVGTNLIEASAGSGKTYAIAGIFLRLLLEKRISVGRILVVTYTTAATEELRTRIRKTIRRAVTGFEAGSSSDPFLDGLVKNARSRKEEALRLLKSALRDFDEAPIFTIHGFCRRTLNEHAFESMSLFDTELIADETALREEIVQDFWRSRFYEAPPEFVSYALDAGCSPDFYLNLVARAAANPDIRIIPEAQPVAFTFSAPVREAFAKVRSAWPKARPEVLEKLGDPALSKVKYKDGGNALISAADLYVASGQALPLFKGAEKMTVRGLREGTNQGKVTPEHPFFVIFSDLCDKAGRLTDEIEGQLLFLKWEIFQYMRRELPVRKRRLNIRSFDDLLARLRDALESHNGKALAGALRKRYHAALVDEFQDTDPVQYAILQTVFGKDNRTLFLIGDPKQAIYSFRGADLFSYLGASEEVDARYTLTRNWRSEPDLIRAVNAIFSKPRHPFLYQEIAFEDAVAGEVEHRPLLTFSGKPKPPLQIWYVPMEKLDSLAARTNKKAAANAIARAAAAGIAQLLLQGREKKALIGDRPIEEGDIAVLVRTNEEARRMKEELTALGVAGVLHSAGNLFDTDEALEIERLLAAIVDPGAESLVRGALAGALFGVSGETLDALGRNESAWERHLSQFRDYSDLWARRGFMPMFRHFMAEQSVRPRLLSLPNGERRLTNILHLSEVLHEASVKERLGTAGLLKWLAHRRRDESARSEEHELRLESDARAVRIVTIHKSKGLEYPVVFCPFNWGASTLRDETFVYHDPKDRRRANLVLTADPARKAAAQSEVLAENIRLLYVSLTRAKHRCCVVWGPFKGAETSSLACILHPPQETDATTDNVTETLSRNFAALSEEDRLRELNDLVRRADGAIEIIELPDTAPGRLPPMEDNPELAFRPFSGVIRKDWRVTSFSSLTYGASGLAVSTQEEPDHDAGSATAQSPLKESLEGFFAFPRGAKEGTFLHAIFEQIDFAGSESGHREVVAATLRAFGFDVEWEEAICMMIRKVLATPFSKQAADLTLSCITQNMRLNELEFYFPLKTVTPDRLRNIFAAHHSADVAEYPVDADRIGALQFEPCRGFMKGYMDLVFRWDGRYYLVDWKSNFLGGRIEDYDANALAQAMSDHYYHLQYHLYALALHRYLASRLPGYDYGKHFGGIFYFFLRGIDPERGSDYGIYRDRPKRELVAALEEALIEEKIITRSEKSEE